MERDRSRRLHDACEELEAALHSLQTVAASATGTGHRPEVRLSQADGCLLRAEAHLQQVTHGATMVRLGLAVRRAARNILPTGEATDLARREMLRVERGLARLRRLADAELEA